MKGDQFLSRFGGTTDRATRVDPARTYAVRQPTLHPIEENRRVGRFRALLQSEITEAALEEMGRLMLESHESYSACWLGSDGTDLIVELARQAGPASGLYGAKITGGGSGGSVAILGRAGADPAVDRIAEQYSRLTGRASSVFRGSSPGACWTDVLRVVE
jgi:L-arabinokinase